MSQETDARLKSLTVKIPEDLHRSLKIYSVEHGRTMGEVVERLIKVLLNATDPERLFEINLE